MEHVTQRLRSTEQQLQALGAQHHPHTPVPANRSPGLSGSTCEPTPGPGLSPNGSTSQWASESAGVQQLMTVLASQVEEQMASLAADCRRSQEQVLALSNWAEQQEKSERPSSPPQPVVLRLAELQQEVEDLGQAVQPRLQALEQALQAAPEEQQSGLNRLAQETGRLQERMTHVELEIKTLPTHCQLQALERQLEDATATQCKALAALKKQQQDPGTQQQRKQLAQCVARVSTQQEAIAALSHEVECLKTELQAVQTPQRGWDEPCSDRAEGSSAASNTPSPPGKERTPGKSDVGRHRRTARVQSLHEEVAEQRVASQALTRDVLVLTEALEETRTSLRRMEQGIMQGVVDAHANLHMHSVDVPAAEGVATGPSVAVGTSSSHGHGDGSKETSGDRWQPGNRARSEKGARAGHRQQALHTAGPAASDDCRTDSSRVGGGQPDRDGDNHRVMDKDGLYAMGGASPKNRFEDAWMESIELQLKVRFSSPACHPIPAPRVG